MDWLAGVHLSEFAAASHPTADRNKVGQALWNFYMHQMHHLRAVQADPHPGNFLISKNLELMAIDFGCIKEIPEEFYTPYFGLAKADNLQDDYIIEKKMQDLELFLPEDTEEQRAYFKDLFKEMLALFTRPFNTEYFDFSDDNFFQEMTEVGQRYAKLSELKNMNSKPWLTAFHLCEPDFFRSIQYDALTEINQFQELIMGDLEIN